MSFKLPRASPEGARRLAGQAVKHQPSDTTSGQQETLGINAVLQVEGMVGTMSSHFLLDSGDVVSVIRHNTLFQLVLSHMEPASIATVEANGLPLDVAGQMSMLVSLGNYCVQHTFLVVHGLTVEGLLGANFLDKHKTVVDFVHH